MGKKQTKKTLNTAWRAFTYKKQQQLHLPVQAHPINVAVFIFLEKNA